MSKNDYILESNNALEIYRMTLRKQLSVKKAQEALMRIGDLEFLYRIAFEFDFADKEKILDAMLTNFKKRNKEEESIYIKREKNIKNAMNEKMQLFQKTKAEWLYLFALNIDGLTAEQYDKIETAICKSGDSKAMFYFAKDIPNAKIHLLADAISQTFDPKWIFMFARNIDAPSSQSKLQSRIAELADYEYVLKFSKFCDCDILLMQKQMIQSEKYTIEKIIDFTNQFDNLNFDYACDYYFSKLNQHNSEKIISKLVKLTYCEKTNLQSLENGIVDSLKFPSQSSYVLYYLKNAKVLDYKKFENYFETITSPYAKAQFVNISKDSAPMIEKSILETNQISTIIDYAENVNFLSDHSFDDYIIEKASIHCIKKYIYNSKNFDMQYIENKLKETSPNLLKSVKQIYDWKYGNTNEK